MTIKSPVEIKREMEKKMANEIPEDPLESENRSANRKTDERKEETKLNEDSYKKLYESDLRKREEELLRREREVLFKEELLRRNNQKQSENLDSALNNISNVKSQDVPNVTRSKDSNESKNGDIDLILKDIHSQLERVEFNSNASLEIAKQEIENSIKIYTDKIKDQMYELKVENETVRKQVMRMRKDIANLRVEIAPGIEEPYERKSNIKNKNPKPSFR